MDETRVAGSEIRLGFLVDGGADAGALPVLTEHLLGRPVQPEFVQARMRGCRQYVNDPKRYQGYVRSFQWRNVLIETIKQHCPSFRQFDAALDVLRRQT